MRTISDRLLFLPLLSLSRQRVDGVFRTWTNASTIHTSGKGVPCGGVYIPRRYSHSPGELVKWSDVERTVDLLYFFLKGLCSSDIDDLVRKV